MRSAAFVHCFVLIAGALVITTGCNASGKPEKYTREDCIVAVRLHIPNDNNAEWLALQQKMAMIFARTTNDKAVALAADITFSRYIVDGKGYAYLQYTKECEQRVQFARALFEQYYAKQINSFPNYKVLSTRVKPGPNTIDVTGPYWKDSANLH